MVHAHCGLLLSDKEEQKTDTRKGQKDMEESQSLRAEWQELKPKGHTLQASMYMDGILEASMCTEQQGQRRAGG